MINYKHSKSCEFPDNPCDLEATDPELMCDNCINKAENLVFEVWDKYVAGDERPAIAFTNNRRFDNNKFKTLNEALQFARDWLGPHSYDKLPNEMKRLNTKIVWNVPQNYYLIVKLGKK
jgi:hypothetical protein